VIPNCTVIPGDVLEVLRGFEDNTFGVVITDPSYASGGLYAKDWQASTAVKYAQIKQITHLNNQPKTAINNKEATL